MASYSTDRPDGFSDEEITQLRAVSERLSVLADMHSQRQIAENVLTAYLGPQTGPYSVPRGAPALPSNARVRHGLVVYDGGQI